MTLATSGAAWRQKAQSPRYRGWTLVELGWKPKAGLTSIARLGVEDKDALRKRQIDNYARWLADRDGIPFQSVVFPQYEVDPQHVTGDDAGESPVIAASRLPENAGRTLCDLGWKPRNVKLTPISRLSTDRPSRVWRCHSTVDAFNGFADCDPWETRYPDEAAP